MLQFTPVAGTRRTAYRMPTRDCSPLQPLSRTGRGVSSRGRTVSYTDDPEIGYVRGDFDALPFADSSLNHILSMEAFYYAADPHHTLEEIRRVLTPGGTFYCAVNYFAESESTHAWQDKITIDMTLWSRPEYREAFREAGLHVATQDAIPDREIEIPDSEAFPTDDWDTREAMVDRYRTWGTLLTVGVAP